MEFAELSSKDGINVDDTFFKLAAEIKARKSEIEIYFQGKTGVTLNKEEKKQNCKC